MPPEDELREESARTRSARTAEPIGLQDKSQDHAVRAGRGVLLTMAAKAIFIVTGFGVHLILPRALGGAAEWGRYGTVSTVTSLVTNALVAATMQTVSRRTSQHTGDAVSALREGLILSSAMGALLGGALFVLAETLASDGFHDPALASLFRLAAVIIASYAVYAALVGSINGRHWFALQAKFDIGFALTRSGAILGGAILGWGALGSVVGWTGAAAGVLGVALALVGVGRSTRPQAATWLGVFAPILAYQALMNGVLQVDQPLLKSTAASLALESGASLADAAELASRQAGFYRAAQTVAFAPYQLIIAVTLVVFPSISHAVSGGDQPAVRQAIRGALRFALLVVLAIAAPVAGAAEGVMRTVYPPEYVAGAGGLAVLALGIVPFALFSIAASILSGAGRASYAAGIAAVGLIVVVLANQLAIRAVGAEGDMGRAAAFGSSLGMLVVLIASVVVLERTLNASFHWPSVARCVVGAAIGYGVAALIPHSSKLMTVVACTCGAGAYFAVLMLSRELGPSELALARRVIRR